MKLSDAYKKFADAVKKRRDPLGEKEKRDAIEDHLKRHWFIADPNWKYRVDD